jgi:hypothetical protein
MFVVMPGLVPGIHVFSLEQERRVGTGKTWLAVTSTAMTPK